MKRYFRRKQAGQSIVLLAAMIVVIIGMVGLSVDVGNAYGQQRRMQNAANAGALGAMNAVLYGMENQDVWNNVRTTLAGNHVALDSAQYTYKLDYIDADGDVKTLCAWTGSGGCPSGSEIANNVEAPPDDLDRVRLTITERVDTYFARVVGRNDLTVGADGDACAGYFSIGVYPVGVPVKLKPEETASGPSGVASFGAGPASPNAKPNPTATPGSSGGGSGGSGADNYHYIYPVDTDTGQPDYDNPLPADQFPSDGDDWDPEMIGNFVYLPVSNKTDDAPGVHVTWYSWSGGNGANELKNSWSNPGSLAEDFTEGTPPADTDLPSPTKPIAKKLDIFDWINGDTGVKASANDNMEDLVGEEILLPMYDHGEKKGNNQVYHFVKMGVFKLVSFNLKGQDEDANAPAKKYILLQYIGDASGGTTTECLSAP